MLQTLAKKMLYTFLVTLCVFIPTSAQEPEISRIEYELRREESENRIVVTWRPNFPATGSTFRVVAKNQLDQETVIDQNLMTPTITRTVPPGTTTIVTDISIKLPYGGASAINDTTKSLDVTVTPFGTNAAASISKTASLTINMPTVKNFFELLNRPITPPVSAGPTISGAAVVKVLDDSITVRASSSQFMRAKAYAHPGTSMPANVTSTPFFSDEELLFDNRPKDFKVKNLSASTPYIVIIVETSFTPTPNAARQPSRAVIDRDVSGNPLRTADPVPRPSIAILSTPTNKKNKTVVLSLRAENASKISAVLEERDELGNFSPVGPSTELAPPNSNAPITREFPVTLSPEKTYRITARAFSANSDLSPVESQSVIFTGKPASLFDMVFLDMTDADIKFIPRQVNEPVSMQVTAILSSGASITLPCTGGTPTAPECSFPVNSIYGQIGASGLGAPVPGNTPAVSPTMAAIVNTDLPVAPGSKRSTAKFLVTVKANDDSAREQTQVFALSLSAPLTPASSSPWKKVLEFGKSLVDPSAGNKSLESNRIKPTGFGAVLGMLLRALVF